MNELPNFSEKSDNEINTWIENHERRGVTSTPLFRALVEERARRLGKSLSVEASIVHLTAAAKAGKFTTYGALAEASNVPWSTARHTMNGAHGHLDTLLYVCHARGLPLLTAICVNQGGINSGDLSPEALAGFTNGARRLGYSIADPLAFLRKCQLECFSWASQAR